MVGIIGIAFGFAVPGCLVARLIGLRSVEAVAAAFPLSLLLLFHAVLLLACFPGGLTPWTTSLLLAAASLAAWLAVRHCGLRSPPAPWGGKEPARASRLLLAAAGAFALLLLARAILQPMISPDAVFRWNHLAALMLQEKGLWFYPPASLADFALYPYPDGFPPLLPAAYFQLYGAIGKVMPAATAPLVVAQYVLCCLYVHRGAALLNDGNAHAGNLALLALLCSPAFFFALFLGQETGITALSAAMFLYYAVRLGQAGGEDRPALAMGAVALALGALSREYGGAFVALAVPVLAMLGVPWRRILALAAMAAALSAPFYVANLARHGNPLYPLRLLPGLPHNTVHAGIMREYAGAYGLFAPGNLREALVCIAYGLPVPLLLLLAGGWRRRHWALAAYALAGALLWAWSTRYTCGGIVYSLRVLAPVVVAMAMMAGGMIPAAGPLRRLAARWWRPACAPLLIPGFLAAMLVPWPLPRVPVRDYLRRAFVQQAGPETMAHRYADALPTGSIVLGDSALFQAELLRHGDGRIRMLPLWTPDLGFLFDDRVPVDEQLAALRHAGFTHLLVTRDSRNNAYFRRFRFFRKFPAGLREVIRGPDTSIYAL